MLELIFLEGDFNMTKQTILITGASSGIGKATVELFSKNGWNVAATMRIPEKSKELANLPGVKLYTLDVTDEATIKNSIEKIIEDFGKIDVLLNNAGYGSVGIFEAYTQDDIQRQFNTNVFGVMNVTREILPHFRANKAGTILTISSVGGQVTFPIYSLYHSTKWAVEGFIESLHYELHPLGINVKLVEPGPIKTDFYGRSQDFIKSPELKEYDRYLEVAFKNSNAAGASAEGPEVVAAKIYTAATDGKNKMRYPIGGNAAGLISMKRFLPTGIFFRVVRSVIEKGL